MKTSKFVPTRPYSIILNKMIAEGYTLVELQSWSKVKKRTIQNILNNKTLTIKVETADNISKLYKAYLIDREAMNDISTFKSGMRYIGIVLGIGVIGAFALIFIFFAIGNN